MVPDLRLYSAEEQVTQKKLRRLARALATAPYGEDVQETLDRLHMSLSEISELCQHPSAVSAMLTAATTVCLVPLLPKMISLLARKAEEGDTGAQKQVFSLLSSASPLKDDMGLDLKSLDTQFLKGLLESEIKQAKELMRDVCDTEE